MDLICQAFKNGFGAPSNGQSFAAVRVEGRFTQMHTRAVLPQQPPYPTLTETASGQKKNSTLRISRVH